jgi:hypothetical protein
MNQKTPHRLLCMVYCENNFVGCVIASADVLRQIPFRRDDAYSVHVYATCGGSEDDLRNLRHRGRILLRG